MKSHLTLLAILAIAAISAAGPADAGAAFGFRPGAEGFSALAREENGSIDRQAGSHPYELTTDVNLESVPESPDEPDITHSDGDLKDLRLDLPAGLIENPSVVAQCSLAEFDRPRSSPFESSLSGESCSERSQIGVVTVRSSYGGGGERTFGVFNLVPPPGAPAEIGFSAYGSPIVLIPEIRQAEGEYQISERSSNISQHVDIMGLRLTLWGTPWDPTHNYERGDCLNEAEPQSPWANTCAIVPRIQYPQQAYLTLPSSCGRPLIFGASIDSWQQTGTVTRRVFTQFDESEGVTL